MIKSQVVVLKVFYDDDSDDPLIPPKDDPAIWDWSSLIDEPIQNSVEVLAAGPVREHPTPNKED